MKSESASRRSYAELAAIFNAGYEGYYTPITLDEAAFREGLESECGSVLFRRTGERVSLLQGVAADEATARGLLQAFPAEAAALQWLNGPAGDPFNAGIASLGGTLAHRQHELLLEL